MAPPVRCSRVAITFARIALFIVFGCLIFKIKQGFGLALSPTQLVMTLITAASFQVLLERIVGLGYTMYRMHVSGEMVLKSAITSPDMYRMPWERVQESTITSLCSEGDADRFVRSEGAYGSDWIFLRQVRMLWQRGWDILTGTGKLEKKTHACIFCRRRVPKDWLSCQFHESYVFRDELGGNAELVDDERAGNLSVRKMDANELRNVITKVSKRVRRPFSTEVVRPTTSSNSERLNVTVSSEVYVKLLTGLPDHLFNHDDINMITTFPKSGSVDFVLEPDEMTFEFKDSLHALKYSAGTANHKRRRNHNMMTTQGPTVTGEMSDQPESCEGKSTAYLTDAEWIMMHYLKRKFSVRIHPCPFEIQQYRPAGFPAHLGQRWRRLYRSNEASKHRYPHLYIPTLPPLMLHISDCINVARIRVEKTRPTLRDKLICYYCSRVLRRDRFAKRQVSGEFLPGHANALKRFCIDCGVKNKTFKPGNQITIHGLPFRICHDCSIPTLGRFCTQCNTCGSCLGQREYSGPSNAKCPRCDHKTLRLHVEQHYRELLGNLDEQIHQLRALVNMLGACKCEDCSRCMDELTMKPKPMDIVQQGLQYEVYHFSQIGKLRLSQIPQHWAPAIVREVGGNNMRIGFEDPRLNLAEGTKIPKTCYLKECGSAEQLVEMISKGRRTRIPGF